MIIRLFFLFFLHVSSSDCLIKEKLGCLDFSKQKELHIFIGIASYPSQLMFMEFLKLNKEIPKIFISTRVMD